MAASALLNASMTHDMTPASFPDAAGFLRDGGECGALIAATDWAATPLGPIEHWPGSLKTALGIVVRAPIAMTLLWGADGVMLYNDRYAVIAGSRHPACMGSKARESWPEIADFNDHVVATVLAGGTLTYRDQAMTVHRNGRPEQAWFTLDYSPVLDEAQMPAGVLAVVAETTGQVRAEAWARSETERLRQMFEQAPGFTALLRGPEHVFDLVNPAYLQLIGHRDVIGRSVREALPDIAGQGFYELLDHVYTSGVAFTGSSVAVMIQKAPGAAHEQCYIDFVYQPMRDADGHVSGLFVQGVDVTARFVSEQAARASEGRNRQILDSAIDYAIIAFDLSGRVTRWNEGAHRILGWAEAEMLGESAERIFTPEDRQAQRMEAEMGMALSSGVGNDERWHLRKSGERFWAKRRDDADPRRRRQGHRLRQGAARPHRPPPCHPGAAPVRREAAASPGRRRRGHLQLRRRQRRARRDRRVLPHLRPAREPLGGGGDSASAGARGGPRHRLDRFLARYGAFGPGGRIPHPAGRRRRRALDLAQGRIRARRERQGGAAGRRGPGHHRSQGRSAGDRGQRGAVPRFRPGPSQPRLDGAARWPARLVQRPRLRIQRRRSGRARRTGLGPHRPPRRHRRRRGALGRVAGRGQGL